MRSVLRIMAPLVCRVGLVTLGLLSGGCPSSPTAEPAPDLAPPADLSINLGPDCEAAKGLMADKRLLCADFTTNGPPQIAGWTFDKDCGDAKSNWIIAQEALMLSNFDSFKSGATETACSFRPPRLNATDLAGFKMLTLAILQSVDVRSETTNQRAQILLDGQTWPLMQFTGGTSDSTVPPFRRSLITIDPNDFSSGLQAIFSVVTKGLAGTGYTGWQIRSIAVLGHK